MSDAKIRCIIKRPDEQYGHVTNISTTLKNMQNIVGGPIEQVTIMRETKDHPGAVVICNEEGKIKGLAPSFRIGYGQVYDIIVGEAIVIGIQGEELVDLPISFKMWKQIMYEWGNI